MSLEYREEVVLRSGDCASICCWKGGGNLWKSYSDCFIVSVKWEIDHQVRVREG